MPVEPSTCPLIEKPRRMTLMPAAAMVTPLPPDAVRIEANVPVQSMVTDLVMRTELNAPASRQLISPLSLVFARAPGKVLHGAVRLHGFVSRPVPETQVRLAWA